jgi:hypothetical protein
MRRLVPLAMLLALATMAGRTLAAEPAISLEDIRNKAAIAADDRALVKTWMTQKIAGLLTVSDADRKIMVSAREAIIYEGRPQAGRSDAFVKAFGEEAIAALIDPATEGRAVSPDTRLNLVMTVAQLQRPEGIPFLCTALNKDPYPATRYWAAKGLSLVADTVADKTLVRAQADMAEAAEKAFQGDVPADEARWLLEMLGKFDLDKAHDVLADAVIRFVQTCPASDPVTAETLDTILSPGGALAKAYTRDTRGEAKSHILTAFATACVWIQPPTALSSLMTDINATMETITGEKIAFMISETPQVQQLSLVEWAEKLARDKKIPKRPALPPVIEQIVKEQLQDVTPPVPPTLPSTPLPMPAGGAK